MSGEPRPSIPQLPHMGNGSGEALRAPTTFRLRTGKLLAGFLFWMLALLCSVAGAFAMAEVLPTSFHAWPIFGQLKALSFCFTLIVVLIISPAAAIEFAALWIAAAFSGYRVEVTPETGAVHVRGDGTAFVSRHNPGRGIGRHNSTRIDAGRLLILHNRALDPQSTVGARMLARFFQQAVSLREFRRPPDKALYVPVHLLHDAGTFIHMIETFRRS